MSDLLERLKQRPLVRQQAFTPLAITCYDRDLALDALAQLVELKNMHDEFDRMKQDVPDVATVVVLEAMQKTYRERKPVAWDDARAILKALRGTADGEGGQ